jgi:small membrane protein
MNAVILLLAATGVLDAPAAPHTVSYFQLIFAPLCLLMALRAAVRTWRHQMSHRLGIIFVLMWFGAALCIAVPRSTAVLARWLQIGRGADLVFYLAILGGLLTAFYFYNRCRQLEITVTQLVRRDAITRAVQGDCNAPTTDSETPPDAALSGM